MDTNVVRIRSTPTVDCGPFSFSMTDRRSKPQVNEKLCEKSLEVLLCKKLSYDPKKALQAFEWQPGLEKENVQKPRRENDKKNGFVPGLKKHPGIGCCPT